ncbi:hypothetical protein Q8F57_027050 [Paraburkholderia terrae]|uniref:hypothetical protein n=1 Tax=Paraburkholderia terrae TaxID=311230 RepID=UPI00296A9A53|nr:hypothetical protein [Paraburkholderia terrae]MDW3660276.1 hypothetical protein [Paraburkholderia terrae]
MNDNVHVLPVQRKRGRRRTIPMPGVPCAAVLNFDLHDAEVETAEQKLARMKEAVDTIAYHLLMAARAITGMSNKENKNV